MTTGTPRLNCLYAEAKHAWLYGGRATLNSGLGDLVVAMSWPQAEIEPGDEAQIRMAYGLPRAA